MTIGIRLRTMRPFVAAVLLAACLTLVGMTTRPVAAATRHDRSIDVALVPNADGAQCCIGTVPTSGTVTGFGAGSFDQFHFTDLSPDQLDAQHLASFDTVVLMQVATADLSADAKAALTAFVRDGGKLVIHDSDGTDGNQYNWLPLPATTGQSCANCGNQGGQAQVTERNTLVSDDPADTAHYVNLAELAAQTDAVGDANLMVSQDPHWFVDIKATNQSNQNGGAVHTYATFGSGLLIYDGFDADSMGNAQSSGVDWLGKLWYLELAQGWNPDNLPHTNPVKATDSDADGIPDDIETQGLDTDHDGKIDVDLARLGADPKHKDVFVYVDYLKPTGFNPLGVTYKPTAKAIATVVSAFNSAPVTNPDGHKGIHLHVQFGKGIALTHDNAELGKTIAQCDYDWTEFQQLKDGSGFPKADLAVFHYVIFGKALPTFPCMHNESPSGISRNDTHDGRNGYGGASDLIVALGPFDKFFGGPSDGMQAGTFMHELGHNLGLGHGGAFIEEDGTVIADPRNHKPNYLSVMNYSFQLDGLTRRDANGKDHTGLYDYSRFDSGALPRLNEHALHEHRGVDGASPLADFATLIYCDGKDDKPKKVHVHGPADFNCKHGIENGTLAADINGEGLDDVPLQTENDWTHLVYNGGAVGQFGIAVTLPTVTHTEPELTPSQAKAIHDALVGPPPSTTPPSTTPPTSAPRSTQPTIPPTTPAIPTTQAHPIIGTPNKGPLPFTGTNALLLLGLGTVLLLTGAVVLVALRRRRVT